MYNIFNQSINQSLSNLIDFKNTNDQVEESWIHSSQVTLYNLVTVLILEERTSGDSYLSGLRNEMLARFYEFVHISHRKVNFPIKSDPKSGMVN